MKNNLKEFAKESGKEKEDSESDEEDVSILETIALIFARCGAEIGKIKRLLDENQISWGYFIDHNVFEPHCNSHPNNLVALDPL